MPGAAWCSRASSPTSPWGLSPPAIGRCTWWGPSCTALACCWATTSTATSARPTSTTCCCCSWSPVLLCCSLRRLTWGGHMRRPPRDGQRLGPCQQCWQKGPRGTHSPCDGRRLGPAAGGVVTQRPRDGRRLGPCGWERAFGPHVAVSGRRTSGGSSAPGPCAATLGSSRLWCVQAVNRSRR